MNDQLKNLIESAGLEDTFAVDKFPCCQSLPLTTRAFAGLLALDKGLVGTPDYLGIAHFWHCDYKHHLRAATPKQRKSVHDALLGESLPLDGRSLRHDQIVDKYTAKRFKKIYG